MPDSSAAAAAAARSRTPRPVPRHSVPPRPGMRRCAILQFEARHEETLPSMIAAANAAGFYPHVFLHNRCKRVRGDIFDEVPGFRAEITYLGFGSDDGEGDIDGPIAAALSRALEDDIAFVLMNSFNRVRGCTWASEIDKRVIAVVHNVDHFLNEPFSAPAVQNPRFSFVALGHHVASELIGRIGKAQVDRVDVIEPVVWGFDEPHPISGNPRRVSIPGAINLRTRDYPGLLDALTANRQAAEGLRFTLGSGGKDREAVETAVRDRGLAYLFDFLPLSMGQVSHADYFASIRSAQAILPLTPIDFEQYQRIKITSAVPASVGFAVPMVLDRWSRACYRAPSMVADNSIAAMLDRLAAAPEAELEDLRLSLRAYRRQAMRAGAEALARLAAR